MNGRRIRVKHWTVRRLVALCRADERFAGSSASLTKLSLARSASGGVARRPSRLRSASAFRTPASRTQTWLRNYYAVRFAVAAVWVAAAFTLAKGMPKLAVAMLVAYPLWDALANFVDARRYGAQWAMILSGAQSVLAGVFMVKTATGAPVIDTLARVAPYAGFGAFYFLVSALWLTFRAGRLSRPAT